MMKKIVLYLVGLIFLCAAVSAYQVNIDAPETLAVGKPLIVTGTTTFGVGTPIDVVLYNQLTTTSEIQRMIVYVQDDRTFRAVFDTTGLKKGAYKVEVPANGLGDSVTMRLVQLIDRSDDIFITSPKTQYDTGKLYLAGNIRNSSSSGFQIEVNGPDNAEVYGPAYIRTGATGDFAADIPVPGPGDYTVSFTDAKGYMGARILTVLAGRQPSVAATITDTPTPIAGLVSAHSRASRDRPAFFIVRPGAGPVTIYTSSSIDWVIEYTEENGTIREINTQGEFNPEIAEFTGTGRTVYVKVYPFRYGISGDVFLFGENVNSVAVSPTPPAAFGAAAGSAATRQTTQSPLPAAACILAAGLAALAVARFRRN